MALSLTWKALFVAVIAILGGVAFDVAPAPRVALGIRGSARERALRESRLFSLAEPGIRQVAAWLALTRVVVPSPVAMRLRRSGSWMGLDATEATSLSVMLGTLLGAGGAVMGGSDAWALWGSVGLLLGVALPFLRIASAEGMRRRAATRELPGAIDALWLCLTAGLDFPGALRFITADESVGSVLRDELRTVLSEIELGRTRTEALRALESRLPFPAVRGFVAAVIQSEQRGNPLAEVLRVQAEVLRVERGVLAEEAAARAAVLLIIPLMLMMGSVLLILFGPFIVGGVME